MNLTPKKILFIIGCVLITGNLILASLNLFIGELLFHTDIARTFLLLENMVTNRKIDLIGPRAGGIPGLFFGPVWYWITLPIFLIGNGNPLYIAVFWFMSFILLLLIVYFIARKIFGTEAAFISAVLLSFYALDTTNGYTQSFGSLLLSPVIFFLIYKFYKSRKAKFLILSILAMGFSFHLQPAFTMIILTITFFLSIIFLIKIKKIHYLLAYLILLIPFSTFIIFDIRHDFLQFRSFISFLVNPPADRLKIEIHEIITNRVEAFISRLNLLNSGTSVWWHIAAFLGINAYMFWKSIKEKVKGREFYLIFYTYYLTFWIITFLFKGQVWDFYHWAFLPLVVIIFASLINLINKKVFLTLFVVVCILLFRANINSLNYFFNSFSGANSSSWLLNHKVAEYVFDNSKENFGYFVYSADEFGYSVKYAMNYVQKSNTNKKGNLCQKMKTTYLIYSPEVPHNSKEYWKNKKVNITKNPQNTKQFGELTVEKYNLSAADLQIQHDPNIICTLIFR
jgi:hypothetical protein